MLESHKIINIQKLLSGDFCFLGRDKNSRQICELLPIIAKSDSSVLIEGESGTGKELIARAIHMLSNRKDKPFITVNCAAIPENLLEAELFGFEKGSFTGAVYSRKGYFELANNGTLFLDEIGDLNMHSQAKILRALQEKEIYRIGSERVKKINVRIISATNKDLIKKIKNNEFREDLYFRLNIIPLKIPPLRDRVEDLNRLCSTILYNIIKKNGYNFKTMPKITKKALKKLKNYSWPGNIRELQNVLERALILSQGKNITENDIILTDFGKIFDKNINFNLKEMEKNLIELALKIFPKKNEAAKKLGIPLRTLYAKIKQYNL